MTVGFAALAGVPPFSGWFSKDSVIEAAQHAATHGGEVSLPGGVAWLVYLGLLLTVVLTAAYAARAWLMTFFGEPRGSYEVRDPSRIMSWTVAALAVPAAILGFFGLGAPELRPHLGASLLSVLLLAIGAGGAYLIWNRDPALDPARALGPVRPPSRGPSSWTSCMRSLSSVRSRPWHATSCSSTGDAWTPPSSGPDGPPGASATWSEPSRTATRSATSPACSPASPSSWPRW